MSLDKSYFIAVLAIATSSLLPAPRSRADSGVNLQEALSRQSAPKEGPQVITIDTQSGAFAAHLDDFSNMRKIAFWELRTRCSDVVYPAVGADNHGELTSYWLSTGNGATLTCDDVVCHMHSVAICVRKPKTTAAFGYGSGKSCDEAKKYALTDAANSCNPIFPRRKATTVELFDGPCTCHKLFANWDCTYYATAHALCELDVPRYDSPVPYVPQTPQPVQPQVQ